MRSVIAKANAKCDILSYVHRSLLHGTASWLPFVLIPLIPLVPLFRLHNAFYGDWVNHIWLIGYVGEYFRRHGSFPVTLDTNYMIGIPFPVFYGFLYYPIAGVVSALLGANVALRITVWSVMLLQCVQVGKTVIALGAERRVALGITLLTATAIYPLSNLYNRAAITELIATSLLLSAFCCLARIPLSPDHSQWMETLQAGLFFALSAGSHPITAVLGGAFLSAWTAFTIYAAGKARRRLIPAFACTAALVVLALSPWLRAMMLYGSRIEVARQFAQYHLIYYEGIDQLGSRFSPYPYDGRALIAGTVVATPYLDAQVNFPLLLLGVFLLFHLIRMLRSGELSPGRPRLALVGVTVVAFLMLGAASIWPAIWGPLYSHTGMIQFSYRLVTYLDLLLLALVLFLISALRPRAAAIAGQLNLCLLLCAGLALQNVVIKYGHAWAVETANVVPGALLLDDRNQLVDIPGFFYGASNYQIEDEYPPNPASGPPATLQAALKVDTGERFGFPRDGHFRYDHAAYAATNVMPFPWNRVLLNGKEVPASQMRRAPGLAIPVTAGECTVQYRLQPDPWWMRLRMLSFTVLAIWAVMVTFEVSIIRNLKSLAHGLRRLPSET
jgi:hypothetical protein